MEIAGGECIENVVDVYESQVAHECVARDFVVLEGEEGEGNDAGLGVLEVDGAEEGEVVIHGRKIHEQIREMALRSLQMQCGWLKASDVGFAVGLEQQQVLNKSCLCIHQTCIA